MPPMMMSVAHAMTSVPWFNVVTSNGVFQFMWVRRGGEMFMSRGSGWWHVSKMTWEMHMAGVEYESQDAFYKRMMFFEEVDARFANAYAVHADTDVQDDDADDDADEEEVVGCGIFAA